MGGYAVRLHRLDRRIQDDGRKQHSESYFGDWGHVQGHAGERPQIGYCNEADLGPVKVLGPPAIHVREHCGWH